MMKLQCHSQGKPWSGYPALEQYLSVNCLISEQVGSAGKDADEQKKKDIFGSVKKPLYGVASQDFYRRDSREENPGTSFNTQSFDCTYCCGIIIIIIESRKKKGDDWERGTVSL